MRLVPPSLDPAVVSSIDDRLETLTVTERVAIPWAVESGSRAWGFPSPDSDYDCRFVYVRAPEDYLGPWPRRDVLETPLDAVLDVNGWDLVKAVQLLVKGNATIVEWLESEIVYRGDEDFRDGLRELASDVVDRGALVRHYAYLGSRQRDRWEGGDASLKKVFYALRPAAVLRWLRVHPDASSPPLDLRTLLAQGETSTALQDAVGELVALKAVTREMGTGAAGAVIGRFVTEELELAHGGSGSPVERTSRAEARERAEHYFRAAVRSFAPADLVGA
ncbi:nucleotidyltransferase domain-containing protein [Oerskovia enterophila]|uniref:nucleotidyltransferase domain-containing protein n=1 Tax=Oerskovia enterophila TaxID=43678 RepID=UPI0033915BAF